MGVLESKSKKELVTDSMGDFWGGLAAMLVVLPSSAAYGIIVFSALGPQYAARGAMAGILGAIALGLATPFIGKTVGLISAPCAPAAAVLSALMAELVLQSSGKGFQISEIPIIVGFTALFSAVLQILFGVLKGGRLIKFIPYQVVTGYLSGVGIIIALGQLPKLIGLPGKTGFVNAISNFGLWSLPSILVGVASICAMVFAPRVTKKIPGAIFGLFGGVLIYFILSIFFPELRTLEGNKLVIGNISASGSFFQQLTEQLTALTSFRIETLSLILVPSLTLSLLLSIDTLKTCVVLDALTQKRHKSDRELIGQGIGNLISFFIGGMPGAGTSGPTLINVASGGNSPRAGIFSGVFVLLALVLFGQFIAWVPLSALAGILLVIAYRMFDKQIFGLLRYRSGRFDFAIIAGVILVAVSVGLIAASGFGIGMAILLFIRDQVRGSVIRRKSYLNQISSKTQRDNEERTILRQHGQSAVFCELQGNLFFGTTDQLFTQLEADLQNCQYVLLDLRRVQSIDYTAVHLLEQMHHQLSERKGCLLFSGMPSGVFEKRDFERYLTNRGLIKGDRDGVKIFETLDAALEWMEEKILLTKGINLEAKQRILDLRDFDLVEGFSEQDIAKLRDCMQEAKIASNQKVFSQGESGDQLFLIRRGSVRVLLPFDSGKRHHVATIEQGGFFGEVSFLDRSTRSADIETKSDTELYILSRASFNERSRADATIGVVVFARLAKVLALRLRAADTELRWSEDR